MKKVFLLLLSIGMFQISYAQLQKNDVKEILGQVDIKTYPKFYIAFHSDDGHKHMGNANLASYEELSTSTMNIEYKENYLQISGKAYKVFLPYDEIKYIHLIKGKAIQLRVTR